MTVTASNSVGERVLVLLPTARDAERTTTLLAEAGVASARCNDLGELCRELRAGAGAMLLTDEALASDSAGQLSEALREQPAWSALPVLVLAREGWTGDARLAAVQSLIVVERPVRTRTLVGMVGSALRDRHHQYQMRDALLLRERQAAELQLQKERLRFALTAGRLGSWELELDTGKIECSELFKASFGRGPDEPLGYRELQDAIHPDDRPSAADAIERCLRGEADYDVEHRVVWPNGETHWLMVRGRAVFDSLRRARRIAGVALDITERRRMHEALAQSESALARQAEQLRLTDRRKDEFLATLAHELRNPLAPIRTGLDLLVASCSGSAAHTLSVMQRQVGHMVRLIDDLLDVSRITSGKLQLERKLITLSTIVDAAIEASKPVIERKQHRLDVSVADGSLLLDADLTRLAQVLGNLLNNASNYTPNGGHIELSAKRDGDFVVIAVRDNGTGIPSDRLSDVFEMFSQVNRKLERSHGGLGIGLALVRRLVEMHGGTSSAESPGVGKGSTFSIRLPLATASAAEATPSSLSLPAEQHDQQRILVVDDNEDAAEMLAMVLAQAGYSTKTAYDSGSALRAVDAWSPQVVILDIGLPDINGYDVARALRRGQGSAPLSLIALTGWGTQDDKQKAMEAGFDIHLTKPVDADALRGALAQLEHRSA
jgi:PAS domain S-box-containing protein